MAPSGVAGGTVKVVVICGSLLQGSYNRGLIRSAIELSKGAVAGVEIEEVDSASLPMLNTDLENIEERNGLGIKATQRMGRQSGRYYECGGLLGGAKGQFHLRQIGIFIDFHFLNAFEPPPKFNPLSGNLIDEDVKLRLKQMLFSLKAFTLQLLHNN